jgi:flagellar hook-associated protein 3 FlgL
MTSSVSTDYLATIMRQPVQRAQAALASAEVEASSGQYADLGLRLGAQSGHELSLRNEVDALQSTTSANGIVATNLGVTTTALDSIRANAQNALRDVTVWLSGTDTIGDLRTIGATGLQSLIADTNTTSSGQYVFGGINSGVAPMADFFSTPPSSAKTAIDQAFSSAFGVAPTDPGAASISASSLKAFLDGPFAAQFQGASWSGTWSSASSTNTSAEIAPGAIIATSTNANQPGFARLAQAYAMLTEFGGSRLSAAARTVVADAASSLISQGAADMTATEAEVGAALERVSDANASMSSQLTILQTRIASLDNVDPNVTAITINTLMTQIQTAYQLTSRLQQMNLAQYLPAA